MSKSREKRRFVRSCIFKEQDIHLLQISKDISIQDTIKTFHSKFKKFYNLKGWGDKFCYS